MMTTSINAAMRDDWLTHAACRGLNPTLFFPERGEPLTNAKQVCDTCEVTTECLGYAMRHMIKEGVWGGKSERERRLLRRMLRLDTRQTPVDRVLSDANR